MKTIRLLLAVAVAVGSVGFTAAASAQPYRGHGYHRACHIEFHHHHRVRVCR